MKYLEEEAAQIFTLYDMTKEITQHFDEEEAFDIFKDKLSESVSFRECLLLDPSSDRMKDRRGLHDYFLFALKFWSSFHYY